MNKWIEWKGGMPPVKPNVRVEYKLRGWSEALQSTAKYLSWKHYKDQDDIIAYRVVEEPK